MLQHPVIAHAGAADETLSVVLLFAGLWIGWVGWSRLRGRGFPRLPRVGAIALLAMGIAFAVSAAVVPRALFPRTTPGQIAADPGDPRPASSAAVSFAEPTQAQEVDGDELDVVLNLSGGRIVDAASTNLTPDTGHIHLSVDGTLVSMTFGLVQAVDLRGLPAGEHILQAEYVAADHGPFDPRVISKVTFETGGAP